MQKSKADSSGSACRTDPRGRGWTYNRFCAGYSGASSISAARHRFGAASGCPEPICRCAADRASYGRYTGNRSVLPINGLPGADRAWLPRIYENLKQSGGADITAYEDGLARRCSFNTNRPNVGRPCFRRAFRRCLQDLRFMTRRNRSAAFYTNILLKRLIIYHC